MKYSESIKIILVLIMCISIFAACFTNEESNTIDYELSYEEGYADGYIVGENVGYEEGYSVGYDIGYEDAICENANLGD